MHEDWTQNYDPEINEEYLEYTWYTISPATSLCADYSTAINTTD